MENKGEIVPVRFTKAEKELLRRTAPGGRVSSWLRELGLEAARRREAVAELGRLMDPRRAGRRRVSDDEATSAAIEAQRDPDDDVLFATALAGGAGFVVSGDAAVLDVHAVAGILAVSPAELLAGLGEG